MTRKADIRARLLARRDLLAPEARGAAGRRIAEHAVRLVEGAGARVVSCYASFRSEVPTGPLIDSLLERGVVVAVPRIHDAEGTLTLVAIASRKDLAPGTLGIPEPVGSKIALHADLHLVPGVAFDRHGGRVGYGRGFYDRFLAEMPAPAWGLAYGFQVLEALPLEAHDVELSGVVTEEGPLAATPLHRSSSGR